MFFFFFFNDTATTEIYTLSLHDALPIYRTELPLLLPHRDGRHGGRPQDRRGAGQGQRFRRSEEHTSELQSPCNLVCRLLLEKKNNIHIEQCRNYQLFSATLILRMHQNAL